MSDPGSLYPKYRNPLDTLTGYANLQNIQNQNRLFQQQFKTNLAVSEGIKASIDPDTGQYDPQRLRAWVQSNPDAGYGLAEIIHQSQMAQQQNIANQKAQIALQQDKLEAAGR